MRTKEEAGVDSTLHSLFLVSNLLFQPFTAQFQVEERGSGADQVSQQDRSSLRIWGFCCLCLSIS